ncbi:MAG: right-handed parallel beta-helix repeat-containing protein, partial [Rhodothermales bacterium]
MLIILLVSSIPEPVSAQDAVWHSCVLSWEDGDPKHDSDGVKDGTLTFGAGKSHVINKCNLFGTDKLVIQAGAVVKIAASCTKDQDSNITSCMPKPHCCNQELWAYGPETSIRIDGATITDVRDNTVGAVIPIEGTSIEPVPSYSMQFNRDGNNQITNSTIKYCGEMRYVGNMTITGSQFLSFGGIRESSSDVLINTAPVITDNLFELAYPSNGGAVIDLRGKSPLFSGNTVRGILIESPS